MPYISEIGKLKWFDGGLSPASFNWWVGLFMTNSSVPNEPLKPTMATYSVLGECNSGTYGRKNITSSVVITPVGNGLVKVSCNSQLWTALAAPTGGFGIACALVIVDPIGSNSDTTNIPFVMDNNGFPRTPDGADFPWLVSANGFAQV